MKQYSISESKITQKNKVSSDYGLSNLKSVFLDGELLTADEDYFVKNGKVVFAVDLPEESKVTLNHTVDTNKAFISPGKVNANSVISRFSSDVKLNENNKYRIGIAIDKDIYEWEFNSRQNPMFTTAKKIYEDIGEFIDGFTEEYINSKIYDNSIAVIDLIDSLAAQETPIENVTYEQDADGFYTTKYKAVNNWVRYKTDIDLTLARYFGISYHYGSELKNIGDIKIEKTTKLPYIDNLLDMLRKQWDEADKVIRGTNVVASATKAGTRYKYDDWDRETTW
jgi:hypothetical protein